MKHTFKILGPSLAAPVGMFTAKAVDSGGNVWLVIGAVVFSALVGSALTLGFQDNVR